MNVICEPQTFRCGNCNRAWQERKDAEKCCNKIEFVNGSSITTIESSNSVRSKRSEYYVPTPAQTTHEAFLQLFDYCKNTEHFEAGFFIKSGDRKRNNVLDFIKYCLEFYEENNIQLDDVEVIRNSHNFEIRFLSNGSRIKTLSPSESSRGHKFHFLLIDQEIDEEIKQRLIYPSLIPYRNEDFSYDVDYYKNNVFEICV